MNNRITGFVCLAVLAAGLICFGWTQETYAAVTSPATSITELTSGTSITDGEVTIKWVRASCVGYQVEYADNAGFTSSVTWTTCAPDITSKTLYNRPKNRAINIRVRTFKVSQGKRVYGPWTKGRQIVPHYHSFSSKVTRKATESKEGCVTVTCSDCGFRYQEPIPKLPRKPASRPQAGSSPAKESATVKARKAAVNWAIRIASDNSFHYGRSKWAHHNGCYFCGTNQSKGSLKRRAGASKEQAMKTYCCNPFITAAYKHGAGAREVDCKVASKRIGLANDPNKVLKNKKAFSKISKPSKVTSLKSGDILLTPTHAMLYIGGGKVAHAAHHDNGVRNGYWNDSIKVSKIPARQWKRTKKIYRYIGNGKF